MDFGHWTYHEQEVDLSTFFGFVYMITDLRTNEFYIGQKTLWNKIRRKPLKGKKRVRLDKRESDWRKYNSSGSLKQRIEQDGPEHFKFEILEFVTNNNELNVVEIEHIIKHGRNKLCANEFICRGASYKDLKQ